MKKAIGYTFLLLLILSVVGYFVVYHFNRRAIPDYNQPVTLPGLISKVSVLRDSFAIPHVYAENETDLYETVGYLTAQDRLWQMDLLRRVTQGRLSEIFGKDMVKTDMLMRILRITEKSKKMVASTEPEVIRAIEAYAKGVNRYIRDFSEKLPIEFSLLGYKPDPWKIEDSFNLIGYIAWDLNGAWNAEIILHKLWEKMTPKQLQELVPGYDSLQSTIYSATKNNELDWRSVLMEASLKIEDLGLEVFHGSNNWVIAGAKTASGKPILANDMHLSFSAPGIWYQIHEVVKGKLDVTGVLLPGQPFVISGHNRQIAWGMTNVMNDDIDFYKESVNPKDSNLYKLDGQWLPFHIKKENIIVKQSDTVHYSFKFTHRGPIISMLKGLSHETISMHWLGNDPSNEVQSIYRINRASNWTGFCDAMRSFIAVSQNVAYADNLGNIGMHCCAGVPIRLGNPIEVLPGDTSLYDWKGLVPFDELPQKYNPVEGFAVSANNRTIDSSYKHYISSWFDLSFRYERIAELLRVEKKFTPADVSAIQTDETSKLAEMYLPGLLQLLNRKHDWSALETNSLKSISAWKYQMLASSGAAAIFEVWYNRMIENLVKDEMGEGMFNEFLNDKILVRNMFHNIWRNRNSILCDNILTLNKLETFDDIAVKSFKESVGFLEKEMGKDQEKWEWGKIHPFVLAHPMGKVKILNRIFLLNRGPFEAAGSFHTVAPYSYKFTDQFNVTSGASQRHIYDLGYPDKSLTVIPSGTSGIPASIHYCDQTELYLDGKYHRDLFTWNLIEQNARYKTTFYPEKVNKK